MLSPLEMSEFLATQKTKDIAKYYPDAIVIGCDTSVVLGERILGKPKDEAQARNMLSLLSDKTHKVITGVCLTYGDTSMSFSVSTDVTFYELYVEEIVEKKYHILKTNDNFYLYKNDIKRCLREMREDIQWMEQVLKKADKEKGEDVLSIINAIERGFDGIYQRITNMVKEHSKYIRATVTRMNYMLNGESDT